MLNGKPKAFTGLKKNNGAASKIPPKINPFTSKTSIKSNYGTQNSKNTNIPHSNQKLTDSTQKSSQKSSISSKTSSKPSNLCVGGTFSKSTSSSKFAKPKTKQQLQQEHRDKMLNLQREKEEKERRRKAKQEELKKKEADMKAARLKERQEAAAARRQQQLDKENKIRNER